MKKTLIIILVVVPLLGVAGYWGYNEFMLSSMTKSIDQAEHDLSSRASSTALLASLSSLSDVAGKAQTQRMPVFESKYVGLENRCRQSVKNAPAKAASWVSAQRGSAWNPVGSEMRPRSEVDDKSLVRAARDLKGVCETGLAFQDRLASAAKRLGIDSGEINGMSNLAAEIKKTATQAEQMAEVGKRMSSIKGRAKGKVQEGLKEIDRANREIEKFAEVSTLRRVCYDWDSALSTIKESRSILSSVPSFQTSWQDDLAKSLVKSDREKIDKIVDKIVPHVAHARSELSKAEREESTAVGRAGRAIGRFLDRNVKKAANSRMGREVAASLKGMVLGTKMFYDLMDVNSSTDLMSWARSYEGDMDQLMNEMDDIQRMDGWSITGKNTFIEDMVNEAHRKSFRE